MEHTAFVKKCLEAAGYPSEDIEALHVEQKTDKEIAALIMKKATVMGV